MKIKNLPILVLLAIPCMISFIACQKQDLEANHSQTGNDPVSLRGDECDPCTGLGCCCWVQLYNDSNNSASLHLCGTTDGAGACFGSEQNCNAAQSGGGQFITLSSGNPKQIFCMDEGSTVRITNVSSLDNAGIRCGCNTTNIDPIEFSISPQDSVKVDANVSCELSGDCS